MCTLLSTAEHPDYSLILISNRDEVFERKSLRMQGHLEPDNKTILMGIDQIGKGTWLAVNKEDHIFSIVMNVQSNPESQEKRCTRGFLPLKMLKYMNEENDLPSSFSQFREYYEDVEDTSFFKLIFGNYSNGEVNYRMVSLADDNVPVYKDLKQEKIFVTSNQYESDFQDFTNIPWAKLTIGKKLVESLKTAKEDEVIERCFEISEHNTFGHINTPIDFQESKRRVRSSVFIPPHEITLNGKAYHYGTRTTTLILIKGDGAITVVERERISDDAGDLTF